MNIHQISLFPGRPACPAQKAVTVTSYMVRWRGHTSADDEWLRLEEHCPDPALVGRPVLFYWPTDGWVRGTVARRSLAAGHSHVVRYDRRSALGAVQRLWLIRSSMPLRTARGGAVGAVLPCALAPAPRFSRPTLTVTAFLSGRRAGPGRENNHLELPW